MVAGRADFPNLRAMGLLLRPVRSRELWTFVLVVERLSRYAYGVFSNLPLSAATMKSAFPFRVLLQYLKDFRFLTTETATDLYRCD